MRSITVVIGQIAALLPEVPPAEQVSNLITLRAELTVLARRAQYVSPESGSSIWESLNIALYRYLPPATDGRYPWAGAISKLVTGAVAQ